MCSLTPLLAIYGADSDGKLYIHVKVYKQGRVYGEILAIEGTVKVRCRECYRWHTVNIKKPGVAELRETATPPETLRL